MVACVASAWSSRGVGESAPISKRYPLYIGLALFLFKVYAAAVATAARLPGLDKSVGIAVNYISAPLACQYTTRLRWLFIHTLCKGLPLRAPVLSSSLSLSLSLPFSFSRSRSFSFRMCSCLLFFSLLHLASASARAQPPPPWSARSPLRKYGPVITLLQGNYQLPGCR